MTELTRILVLLLLCDVAGCGPHVPAPIEPVPPNEFLSSMTMLRIDRGKDPVEVTSDIEIVVNSGFVAHFNLKPLGSFPNRYVDRDVVPSVDWGMLVRISPRDRQQSADDTILNPVTATHSFHYPGPVNQGGTALWTACGLTLDDLPKTFSLYLPKDAAPKTDNLSYWTYICGPKDLPGEYVYEVQLLPTGAWLSPFRKENGAPVVLKRGLLRVLPKDSEQQH